MACGRVLGLAGEVPERYLLRDFCVYLLFDVQNPLGEVTVVPPPPASSYQFAAVGALVAKMGYRVRVLNMSTCRQATISKVLAHASGELLYIGYAPYVAYAGYGGVVDREELAPETVRRIARGNVQFRVPWERCLAGAPQRGDVIDLGRLPEALSRIETWLAERLGRR
ncbi:MAG: hypothetical protein LM577_04740 [Thermoproteaceae archaeon]|nr:hypothetical protein [Thermoproteaceae archaeon]